MKFSRKIAIGAAAVLGLAAGVVIAHPGQMGGGMGMHGPMGGKGHGPMGGQQLMTPEERSAFQEKMRNAKTPEERRTIAEAQRAEMHKRLTERGAAPKAPADTERSK